MAGDRGEPIGMPCICLMIVSPTLKKILSKSMHTTAYMSCRDIVKRFVFAFEVLPKVTGSYFEYGIDRNSRRRVRLTRSRSCLIALLIDVWSRVVYILAISAFKEAKLWSSFSRASDTMRVSVGTKSSTRSRIKCLKTRVGKAFIRKFTARAVARRMRLHGCLK